MYLGRFLISILTIVLIPTLLYSLLKTESSVLENEILGISVSKGPVDRESGVFVERVLPGSIAEKCGLMEGDVITDWSLQRFSETNVTWGGGEVSPRAIILIPKGLYHRENISMIFFRINRVGKDGFPLKIEFPKFLLW